MPVVRLNHLVKPNVEANVDTNVHPNRNANESTNMEPNELSNVDPNVHLSVVVNVEDIQMVPCFDNYLCNWIIYHLCN